VGGFPSPHGLQRECAIPLDSASRGQIPCVSPPRTPTEESPDPYAPRHRPSPLKHGRWADIGHSTDDDDAPGISESPARPCALLPDIPHDDNPHLDIIVHPTAPARSPHDDFFADLVALFGPLHTRTHQPPEPATKHTRQTLDESTSTALRLVPKRESPGLLAPSTAQTTDDRGHATVLFSKTLETCLGTEAANTGRDATAHVAPCSTALPAACNIDEPEDTITSTALCSVSKHDAPGLLAPSTVRTTGARGHATVTYCQNLETCLDTEAGNTGRDATVHAAPLSDASRATRIHSEPPCKLVTKPTALILCPPAPPRSDASTDIVSICALCVALKISIHTNRKLPPIIHALTRDRSIRPDIRAEIQDAIADYDVSITCDFADARQATRIIIADLLDAVGIEATSSESSFWLLMRDLTARTRCTLPIGPEYGRFSFRTALGSWIAMIQWSLCEQETTRGPKLSKRTRREDNNDGIRLAMAHVAQHIAEDCYGAKTAPPAPAADPEDDEMDEETSSDSDSASHLDDASPTGVDSDDAYAAAEEDEEEWE